MEQGPEPSRWGHGTGAGRPSRDIVLGLVCIGAGALGVFAAIFPPSDVAPTSLPAGTGIGSIVAGVVLLLMRGPSPTWLIRTYLVVGIVCLAAIIADVNTQLGTALTAVPYIWFCVYLGAYLEPRETRALVALICVSFGVALIISDVAATASIWVIYSGTIIVTTEALLVSNHALRVRARQDPLTGLLNRLGLEESIGPILAIGERIGEPTALALIDLDDFKAVNDSQGHLAGDRVLVDLARTWTLNKRDADLLARFGGDEFIVVMPATDREHAKALIERLAETDSISWSWGVVEVRPGEGFTAAVNRADQALYAAKGGAGDVLAEVLPES